MNESVYGALKQEVASELRSQINENVFNSRLNNVRLPQSAK